MNDPIDQLLSRDDVQLADPADPADVRALARQYDGPLPAALLALWRRTDGLDLDSIVARILGPGEIAQLLADVDYQLDLTGKGIVPILDDRESNYLAARVTGPLAPRIVFMQHDDAARLIYRDVGGVFRSLTACSTSAWPRATSIATPRATTHPTPRGPTRTARRPAH